ncbi:restriction endonuclease subunit S [Aliivibrio logei]|uniref:restriction endonuclease subunit S n=1 Tax=Aliivibrio logei TaxID=688 RepID=UPI0035C88528
MSEFVPEGWSQAKVGSLSLKVGSGVTPRGGSKAYFTSGVKFIRSQNVHFTGLKLNDVVYISQDIHDSMLGSQLQDNDVLLNITGASIGRCTFVPNSFGAANVNQHVCIIRPNEKIKSAYLSQWFSSDSGQNAIMRYQAGGNREGLNFQQIRSMIVTLPPLPEQQKIAAILTSVDEVIEKTQAQINKLKDLKTGMMQELLTRGVGVDGKPHTEFKDSPVGRIPKGWEVDKLSSIINVIESGWSPQCESEPAQVGEWCILKTTAVSWDGFNYSANKKLPTSLEPRINIQVNVEDILITRAGPADRVGVVVYVNSVPKKVMLSDKIIRLRVNNTCNAEFISLWLSSTFAQHFMSSRVSGLASSQTNISQAILASIPCIIPSLVEQEMIASSIRSINERIDIVNAKFSTSKQLKKALMQDLLTGKVRVKVDSE